MGQGGTSPTWSGPPNHIWSVWKAFQSLASDFKEKMRTAWINPTLTKRKNWRSGLEHKPSFRDLEWCSEQSWGWCFGASPSAWWEIPCTAAQQYETCPSWSCTQSQKQSLLCQWPDPDPRYDPLGRQRENSEVNLNICQDKEMRREKSNSAAAKALWDKWQEMPPVGKAVSMYQGRCAEAVEPEATSLYSRVV